MKAPFLFFLTQAYLFNLSLAILTPIDLSEKANNPSYIEDLKVTQNL